MGNIPSWAVCDVLTVMLGVGSGVTPEGATSLDLVKGQVLVDGELFLQGNVVRTVVWVPQTSNTCLLGAVGSAEPARTLSWELSLSCCCVPRDLPAPSWSSRTECHTTYPGRRLHDWPSLPTILHLWLVHLQSCSQVHWRKSRV